MQVSDLPGHWREHATGLRGFAAEGAATAFESAANELEEALRSSEGEELTVPEAAQVSGYSERRLRELLAEGSLPNAGAKGRPRVRRGDLPWKPATNGAAGYDVDADADQLVERMEAP